MSFIAYFQCYILIKVTDGEFSNALVLQAGCDGTNGLHLVGCGYNAYPTGSQYAEYPQMDNKQEDRPRRKYRYIVHAEQNALTFRFTCAFSLVSVNLPLQLLIRVPPDVFRARDIRPQEPTLLFVTKCPCDECIPLIRGAGISHIYTTDQDRGKDKGDISYLRLGSLKDTNKFIVSILRDRSRNLP